MDNQKTYNSTDSFSKSKINTETINDQISEFTGVAISSNCMKIQVLFQRHTFNVTDLLLETLEQKVVTFFL